QTHTTVLRGRAATPGRVTTRSPAVCRKCRRVNEIVRWLIVSSVVLKVRTSQPERGGYAKLLTGVGGFGDLRADRVEGARRCDASQQRVIDSIDDSSIIDAGRRLGH